MKRLPIIISCFCLSLMAIAMDRQLERINSIKKDAAYLYSDVTMSTPEDAASQAYELLQREVFAWTAEVGEEKPDSITIVDINSLADTIMARRANMYRVFAYVKKEHVLQLFRGEEIKKEPNDPKTETVAAPVTEPIVVKDSLPQKDTVVSESVRHLLMQNYLGRKGGVLEQIKKAKTFFELKDIIEPLKKSGDITDYGKFATAEKPEECYLIVYDPAGNIRALLGKGTETRKNLKTGKDDNIANYRGCGAIWFKLNE